jgi:phosphoglycerol transferase MdoB-like AlkP superfamily enzyme
VRLDAFTFHYAFEYMKKAKPRVLYIAFDETDDFAHGGKYDLYLDAAHYTDAFIKSLWEWCQLDPRYRDKTTFIITSDHGRGMDGKEDWRHHGSKVPNADQIWLAIMGPDTPATGEIKNSQNYQNQIASTISTLLGLDYRNQRPVGVPVRSAFTK